MGVTKSWTRLSNFHFLPLAVCLARVTSQLSLYLHEDLYHLFGHVQAHSFVTPLHGDFCAHLIKVQEELDQQTALPPLPCWFAEVSPAPPTAWSWHICKWLCPPQNKVREHF